MTDPTISWLRAAIPSLAYPRRALTDMGNAERLQDRYGDRLRYLPNLGWIAWDGQRWKTDVENEATRLAFATVRSIALETSTEDAEGEEIVKWAHKSESAGKISAMMRLAKNLLPVETNALDVDPYLVNCTNGVFDVRTGELSRHEPGQMLTHMCQAAYKPEATCPRWQQFLERVQPNPEIRQFLQRAAGYSLLGLSTEHVLLLNFGNGANGKTTFLEALKHVLGDYAQQAPTSTLMRHSTSNVPADIAMLRGARFVVATESEQDEKLAEATVKRLTGGDSLTARFLHRNFTEFTPTHTLWLATNYRPRVAGTDNGIWRRLAFIPWTVDIPEAEWDHGLPAALQDEADGILAWAIEGAIEYQAHRLGIPDVVKEATAEYRREQDVLGGFMAERCLIGPDYSVPNIDLYASYSEYCRSVGEVHMSNKAFTTEMLKRGYRNRRAEANGSRRWVGIGLVA